VPEGELWRWCECAIATARSTRLQQRDLQRSSHAKMLFDVEPVCSQAAHFDSSSGRDSGRPEAGTTKFTNEQRFSRACPASLPALAVALNLCSASINLPEVSNAIRTFCFFVRRLCASIPRSLRAARSCRDADCENAATVVGALGSSSRPGTVGVEQGRRFNEFHRRFCDTRPFRVWKGCAGWQGGGWFRATDSCHLTARRHFTRAGAHFQLDKYDSV
jgi:hypothetical protein